MILIGVAQHNPLFIQSELKKLGRDVHVLQVGAPIRTKAVLDADCLFLVSYKDFVEHLPTLNSPRLKGRPVFLFASVLRLSELSGCYALDYRPNDGLRYRLQQFQKSKMMELLEADDAAVEIENAELLPVLVKTVQEGSFLSPLMTLLYMLPNTQQTQLRTDMLKWMVSGNKSADIKALLIKRGINLEVAKALYKHLTSSTSTSYRAALAEIQAAKTAGRKAVNYAKLIRQHGVVKYEIRYILKSLKQDDLYGGSDGQTLDDIYYQREKNADKQRRA